MPTINQLSAVSSVSAGDQVPIYAPSSGDARKASMNTIMDFVNANVDIPPIAAQDVSFIPAGTLSSTNVQAAIIEQMTDLSSSGGAALVGFAPSGTLSSTTVQGAITEQMTDLSASSGSSLVGFLQSGTGAIATTVQTKMRETVSVKDFGATGDGSTDDTTAIQTAFNSGASTVVFPAGGTYLINGGLTLTSSGVTVVATGATVKLKNSASSLSMLSITGTDCVVDGGTWDGNKSNGNIGTWGSAQYFSFNIYMNADRCTVKNIYSINTWGMAVKGFGNYLSVLNCRIQNTQSYGIFFDGSVSVSNTGNRAIGNTIDMSDGQIVSSANQGQGILFTAGTGQAQTAWELADNNIIGPQTSVTDQAINLCVRGNSGIVSNNTTRYGAMGFSEGGANTVITGNRFLNIVGTTGYGIEPSGGNTVISNNVVTDAIRGIMASGVANFDNLVITGNQITATSYGIYLQINTSYTGRNCVISGNNISFTSAGSSGVYTSKDVKNIQINGNVLIGPSATFASGRGVYIDTPSSDAYVYVTNNTIANVQRPYAVYSASALTVNYLFATGNNLSLAGTNTNSSIWTAEGSATIGTTVISANNVNPAAIGLGYNAVDQGSNITIRYGAGSPAGAISANVGSYYINTAGGAGTTLFIKESGTGTAGWVGK